METNSPQDTDIRFSDRLKAWSQYVLPHYALSNFMYYLTRSTRPWWKNSFIQWFANQYKVDMREADDSDFRSYRSFNAFFTRALKPGARPIDTSSTSIISPVDGQISQLGGIKNERVFQAKGRHYSLLELLAGDSIWAKQFEDGLFATIYLSPKDYHRIHAPVTGQLIKMTHVPGRLFSVSPATTRAVPRLFARNERVISYFDSDAGPLAVIMVGALFVASMETVWQGVITPPHGKHIAHWHYDLKNNQENQTIISLNKGQELGRFNMGSTVILLFSKNSVRWNPLAAAGHNVKMGVPMAEILT